jgi:hypothetical protein
MRNNCVLLTATVVGFVSLGVWTSESAAGQSKALQAPAKNAKAPAKARSQQPPAKVKEVHREEKHKDLVKGKVAPVPGKGTPRAQDDRTKHRKQMEHALRLLHEARKKAASVPWDHFGDHRRLAVESIDRAIRQMNEALKWEREHRH